MKRKLLLCMVIGLFAVFQINGQSTESYAWDNVVIGGGGFVSGVFFSPVEQNVIYARTDVGGAYRWNEATQSWISMTDWVNADERGLLGIEALAIDPSTPGKVYMMAGTVYWNQADDGIGRSAFLRSSDYGQTWEKIPVWDNSTKYFNVHGNGMGRGNGERLAIDPANSNTMFYGSRNKGLWKSTNNGSTWSKVNSFSVDTTWNGCGISFVAYDPSNTSRIYVGVLRKADNVFVSEDGGASWSLVPGMPQPTYDGSTSMGLMPQRIAIRPDGSAIYITTGNGAGPHTMAWDEGWGPILDWFNRGTVYKYEVATGTWTDISPQNFIDPEESDNPWQDPSSYFGNYSGISMDPDNPDHMVVSSISSYRGPQFWLEDGTWHDEWGDNIFVTEDGGEHWVPSFQYYWLDGGYYPNAEQMDENGIPWMFRSTIHWIGSTAIDPFNPQRVFVTSGNGVFKTEDIFNYEWTYVDEWGNPDTSYIQSTVWQVASHGIEEVVPEDVVSIPGGPLVSVIGDYDGFMHEDITQSPANGRHKVSAAGSLYSLGSNTGLAYAPQNGRLAKCAKIRSVSDQYTTTPIGPVQWSDDNGLTWTTEVYTSNPPTDLLGGKVALSADGAVTLWMPSEGTTMYRNVSSSWTTVSGISFSGRPVGDQVNADLFYVYNKTTGYMFVSTDKGISFSQAGYVGTSNFRNAVAVPDNEGHVWVPIANSDGTGSLMRSSDGGASFTAVEGVGYCEAVGFGKAATGANYPTVFVFAEIDGVLGVWRSIDQGASWVRVNDGEHEYGGLANGEFVVGDMNVFGRVYMSTAGRGIVYGDPTGSTTPVTGVSISPSVATVSIGGTVDLDVVITPSNASNQSVSWNSGNSNIATVNSSGLVTGVIAGTVAITVTTVDGGYIATAQVTVEAVSVEDIAVAPTSVTLDPGETVQLTATISPSDATNQNVIWSTSDATVATVDTSGLVTAVSDGSASITATSEDGGYTATASITVNYVETPVTGVSVSPSGLILGIDETGVLTASVIPSTANNQVVYWTTSDASVATVDDAGIVTGIEVGTATITVTTDDGGYTATSTITVSDVTTGTILAEYWDGISGMNVTDLTSSSDYPDNPTSSEYLTSLEGPVNRADNYGTRIRGYLHPQTTGTYTFWIAGDDYCDLYLSNDASVENASRIAYVEGWTNSQEWDKYASQQSVTFDLTAGQQYYIEVLHKESYGGDNIAVAWEGPGISQQVIDGAYLSPYVTGADQNSAPVATVTASPISGAVPLSVSFDASGSTDADGDVLTYNWDFGDGSSATGVTTNHTYNVTGTYEAVVTVSDSTLSDVASITISVTDNNIPVTGVTVAPASASISVGGTTALSATVIPSNATDPSVSWSSSNTSVATVDASGVVTGVSAGTANIVVTTNAGGFTAISEITVSEITNPCENPISISIPFAQDGAGEYCFVTTTEIAYINSWNMGTLEINGVDYTNTWSNNLPDAIDGQWFIYYKGNYPWSHFEAPAAKNAMPDKLSNDKNTIEFYPNPFTSSVKLFIEKPELVQSIEIYDNLGRVVQIFDETYIDYLMSFGNELVKGIYIVKVNTLTVSQVFIINKN